MHSASRAALFLAAAAAGAAQLEVNLVRDCGGVGDGVTYNTAAFARCLALVGGAAGAGAVFVPPGRFLSGPFNITRDGTTLVLAGNATIVASPDTSQFPLIAPLPSLGQCREYTTLLRYSAFITVWNASRVRLTSNASAGDEPATLDGNGPVWYAARESGVLKNDPGAVIETMYAEGVEIDHLRVWWSPYWHIHPYASANVHIHDADISSFHSGPETDGIDPDCSHDVLIERVTIDTGDDAIAVKSGWDQIGIDFAHASFNIIVRDSVLSTGANAFCMGSEMSGGIYNVSAVNITCLDVDTCFRLKSSLGRGGVIRDISMRDSRIIGAGTAFDASDFYGGHPLPVNASLVPTVGDSVIERVSGVLVGKAGLFAGLTQRNITGMSLRDIALDAPAGSWACSNVTGSFRNVTPAPCANMAPEGI